MLNGCAIAQCCARALQIGKASAAVILLCLSCHCHLNLEMLAHATIVTTITALQSCGADLQQYVFATRRAAVSRLKLVHISDLRFRTAADRVVCSAAQHPGHHHAGQ